MNDPQTHRGGPHLAALKVWHAAHQPTAIGAVVLGDKSTPEIYHMHNEGCIVDLAEEATGQQYDQATKRNTKGWFADTIVRTARRA